MNQRLQGLDLFCLNLLMVLEMMQKNLGANFGLA